MERPKLSKERAEEILWMVLSQNPEGKVNFKCKHVAEDFDISSYQLASQIRALMRDPACQIDIKDTGHSIATNWTIRRKSVRKKKERLN